MVSKTPPLADFDTIHFSYFAPEIDPNKPDERLPTQYEPAKLWAKIHGEWFRCPEKRIRDQIREIRNYLRREHERRLQV